MRYILYFLAGVILICTVFLGIQHFEISRLDTELATAKAQVVELTNANKQFAAQVNDQNKAIAGLAATAKAEHDKAAAATAEIEKKAQVSANALQKALDSVKKTGNECKDTFAYIDVYFRGVK